MKLKLLSSFAKGFFILSLFLIGTEAESNASISIQSKTGHDGWTTDKAIYPLKGQKVLLKVKKITKGKIRWFQIIPDLSIMYKNANHPWESNPYKWVGFDKIKYNRYELNSLRDKWEIEPPFEKSNADSVFFNKTCGSFWYQAEVEINGKTLSSPGIKQADYRGLSPSVFRISVRDGEGYTGYVTSFFNVPGLFGSIPYQSNNYIGADCADLLIAAYAKWKNKHEKKNYNVAMLINKFPKVSKFNLSNGEPDKIIKWNKDIKSGDFIAVRYAGSRQFQHIGALYKDSNSNSVLDKNDIVLHAGPVPLQYSELATGCFDGYVIILRP